MNALLYRFNVFLVSNKNQYRPETFSSSLSSGVIASVSWGMEQSSVSGKSYMTRKALYLETVTLVLGLNTLFKHEICKIAGFICLLNGWILVITWVTGRTAFSNMKEEECQTNICTYSTWVTRHYKVHVWKKVSTTGLWTAKLYNMDLLDSITTLPRCSANTTQPQKRTHNSWLMKHPDRQTSVKQTGFSSILDHLVPLFDSSPHPIWVQWARR